jgi:hypothetical protein
MDPYTVSVEICMEEAERTLDIPLHVLFLNGQNSKTLIFSRRILKIRGLTVFAAAQIVKNTFVPSNVLSSTYFLGKTFFFSKIFLGDPPLIFLVVCLKFRSMERWSEKFDFHGARSPKKRFSADVELRSIVPNFVM